ncbi:hypothetical protein ES703_58070 [subsurface metagenome]
MIIQGREITPKDIEFIRKMIKAHPSRGRTQLSKELALLWNWRAANGQLKDMACRTFLLKLEKRGYLIPCFLAGTLTAKPQGKSLVPMFPIRLLPLLASLTPLLHCISK